MEEDDLDRILGERSPTNPTMLLLAGSAGRRTAGFHKRCSWLNEAGSPRREERENVGRKSLPGAISASNPFNANQTTSLVYGIYDLLISSPCVSLAIIPFNPILAILYILP